MENELSPRINVTSQRMAVPVAAGGLIIDVWLFVLPLVAIYKLQLQSTRRIGLTVMFSTGLM